jgi:hypothetical protein
VANIASEPLIYVQDIILSLVKKNGNVTGDVLSVSSSIVDQLWLASSPRQKIDLTRGTLACSKALEGEIAACFAMMGGDKGV